MGTEAEKAEVDGPRGARSTLSADYQRDWPAYFDAVADKPPRDTLLRALDAFDRERPADAASGRLAAVDLGCGEGRDAREILRRGWRVVAVDGSAEGIGRVGAGVALADSARLHTRVARFEDADFLVALPTAADLINASFSLPFCHPDAFPCVWAWIGRTLARGGRFCGQLFGDEDEWRDVRPRSHFTRVQVETLLAPFAVEHLEEVRKEGNDATGLPKYHHVFHIVARRA